MRFMTYILYHNVSQLLYLDFVDTYERFVNALPGFGEQKTKETIP